MNTLILFTILISFETPNWQQQDGIYYKEINEIFTLVQYIEGTGYVFSVDIADLGFADALDVCSELSFLGKPAIEKGSIIQGFYYVEFEHEYRIIFFFNSVRFRLEIIK